MPEVASTVTIRMALEPLDVVQAYQMHNRDQLWRRATVVTIIVMLALAAVALHFALPDQPAGVGVVLAGCLLGALVFPRLMIRFYVPMRARRIYRQQKTLQQPINIAFETGGLRTAAPFGNSFIPWADFRKLREDKHVMLFYHSDALFQFVPKRFLAGLDVDRVRRVYAEAQGTPAPDGPGR